MGVQFIPLIKALAPYLTPIITSATVFTSKPEVSKTDPIVAQQIMELQDAATKNAEALRALAKQLQKIVTSAEEASIMAKRQVKTYKILVFLSLAVSAIALVLSIYGVAR